jgi:hypothetical protein
MKISRDQALAAFGTALGGAYTPSVDRAMSSVYDAFATGLSASGIEPGKRELRMAAAIACGHVTRPKADALAALAIAQSLYSHLLDHPAATPRLLRDPELVIAALDAHWPADLSRRVVAERIAFACPEAADRLLA